MRVRVIAMLVTFAPLATLAGQGSASHGSDLSLGVRFGTLGIGPELSKLLTPHIGARVGLDFFSASHTFTESDITLDAKLKLKAFTGLLDFFPSARGSFHLTGGVITNPMEITANGTPAAGGTYTINHHTYTSGQVGTLSGSGKWPSASPYFGLGFGTPANSHSSLAFLFDIGAAIGKPKVLLASSNSSSNSTLAADIAAQQDTIQTKANKLPFYPAISFGLVYRF